MRVLDCFKNNRQQANLNRALLMAHLAGIMILVSHECKASPEAHFLVVRNPGVLAQVDAQVDVAVEIARLNRSRETSMREAEELNDAQMFQLFVQCTLVIGVSVACWFGLQRINFQISNTPKTKEQSELPPPPSD